SGALAADRAHVRLTVTDDGAGMDPATLAQVFEPFFTTKPRDRGTGLGLAVVHGIVGAYGGAYRVESRVGAGTRFAIYLPAADAFEPDAPAPPLPERARGGETILLVDDEADLVAMTATGLRRLGYTVAPFLDPAAALAAFRRDPGAWAAVV